MSKVWLIALNALTRLGRDRKALIMLLLMPMILVGILGAALKDAMYEGKISPVPVILVNADQPAKPELPPGAPAAMAGQLQPVHLGQVLATDVLGSDEVKEILQVTAGDNLEAAKEQVARGKVAAVIHVPATYSADVLAGKPVQIDLFTDPGRPTGAAIAEQIVRAFTEEVTTGALTARILGPGQTAQASPGIHRAGLPKVVSTPSGTHSVSAMQYYAAAMALMFMLMTAFNRAKDILHDRDEGTLSRILTSPTAKWVVVTGQVLGNVVVTMTQFLILMAGTRLLYGVRWDPWAPALLLGFAFALACAGIGTAVAGVLTDPQAADTGMGVVSNIFAALSGGMFPLYIFPASMKLMAKFIPNYWALQGFLDHFAGLGSSYLWLPVAILATIGLVTGSLGAWRLAAR